MARSVDPDYYYQSNDSIAERARKAAKSRNKAGSPIRLGVKITSMLADPTSTDHVYVAHSSGIARRLELSTGQTTHIYRASSAPLTCLAIGRAPAPVSTNGTELPEPALVDENMDGSQTSPGAWILYAGSWDKSIYSWHVRTGRPNHRLGGKHGGMIKSLAYVELGAVSLLASGAGDASIVLWDAIRGTHLHTISWMKAMSVLSLAFDPASPPIRVRDGVDLSDFPREAANAVTLFSASSDGAIQPWRLYAEARHGQASPIVIDSVAATPKPLRPHPSTVYALAFAAGVAEPDLWTAAADGRVLCLSRDQDWAVDMDFHPGGHVRCIAVGADGRTVASAGRDEDVRVWDAARNSSAERFEGHFDEVYALLVLPPPAVDPSCSTATTSSVPTPSSTTQTSAPSQQHPISFDHGSSPQDRPHRSASPGSLGSSPGSLGSSLGSRGSSPGKRSCRPLRGRVVSAGLDGTVRVWPLLWRPGIDAPLKSDADDEGKDKDKSGGKAEVGGAGGGGSGQDGDDPAHAAATATYLIHEEGAGYDSVGDQSTMAMAAAGDAEMTRQEEAELQQILDEPFM